MKGYSKIKLTNSSSKSRSMDFSDQPNTTLRIQKPISIKKSPITITQQQPPKFLYDDYDDYNQDSGNHQEQDGNFPMKMLTKNQSAVASGGTTTDANSTSTVSNRFKIEKQNSTGRTLHTAVKRAMSIRRSSSVSERYSRIHDQYSNLFDVDHQEHEEDELHMSRSKNNMKKQNRGSILKTCKRIFGL